MSHGKRDFGDMVNVKNPRWGDYPSGSNLIISILKSGRLWKNSVSERCKVRRPNWPSWFWRWKETQASEEKRLIQGVEYRKCKISQKIKFCTKKQENTEWWINVERTQNLLDEKPSGQIWNHWDIKIMTAMDYITHQVRLESMIP